MKSSVVCLVAGLCLLANRASAEVVYGLTAFRELVQFDSATPGTISSTVPITGLVGQANFESIIGIDFRPATGQLYALGNEPGSIYRLYTINPVTGVASQVGPNLSNFVGNSVGFDFNPVVDRIRITTDLDRNYRYNPNDGLLVLEDAQLVYAAGDPNFGVNPNVVGSAYINNFPGASSTTLFNIDSERDVLTTQIPPNNGVLNTVGALGVDFSSFTGFDISPSGGVFASSANPAGGSTGFYAINLGTGAASFIGNVGTNLLLNDIAVIPEPTSLGLLVCGMAVAVRRRRRA